MLNIDRARNINYKIAREYLLENWQETNNYLSQVGAQGVLANNVSIGAWCLTYFEQHNIYTVQCKDSSARILKPAAISCGCLIKRLGRQISKARKNNEQIYAQFWDTKPSRKRHYCLP